MVLFVPEIRVSGAGIVIPNDKGEVVVASTIPNDKGVSYNFLWLTTCIRALGFICLE